MPVEKYNIHVHEIEHAHYPAHNCVGVYSTCMRHIKADRSTLHDLGGHRRLEAVSLQSRPAPLASSTAPTDERYSSPADVSSPKPSNADTQATGRDGRNLQTQSTVHKCWETCTHTHMRYSNAHNKPLILSLPRTRDKHALLGSSRWNFTIWQKTVHLELLYSHRATVRRSRGELLSSCEAKRKSIAEMRE